MRLTRLALGKLISGVLLSIGALLPVTAFAQAEIEPNDNKATATLIALPSATTPGVITGNSVSGAGVGLDYFRVTTAAQATPGFYRHRLIVTTTGTAGHTLSIRGLLQTAGVPQAGEAEIQASVAPARLIQWYTSQAPGTLFVRMAGVVATTADYSLNYEVTPVTEVNGPTIPVGSRVITSVGQTGAGQTDTDLWVYDGSRAAIATFGNDDEFGTTSFGSRLTRVYAAGVFHMAISNFNIANDLGSPPDDRFRTGNVVDFPGVTANSSTTTNLNVTTTIDGISAPATKVGAFDVVFVQFTVGAPTPTANIADASAAEGNAGSSDMLLPVTLTAPSATPVTVDFATANGTATAGSDYTATSGTLTFAPGSTTQNVTVSVAGDTTVEADETFFVNLSAPSGALIGDGQGQGTITNDDLPGISVGDASVVEGNSGAVDLIAPVTLDQPALTTVTVAFATADNTATAGSDYTATSGVLTFAPGTTALGVTVSVTGDTTVEADETFFVNLTAPTNATIVDAQGLETITNDDVAIGDENAELSHGFRVTGSLASNGVTPDTDVYPISQKPFSSYEVVVDAASGDVSPVNLERLDATSTSIQTSLPVGTGTARSLRWRNNTSSTIEDETVRVASGGCQSDCGADDTYRLRAYETTGAMSRFNNTGSQVTILLLQNPTDYPINTNVYFWDTAGVQLHMEPVTIAAKNIFVLNLSTIVPLQAQSGSITVVHDGRYGDLAGKSVALEPATGFSFDSPMLTRPR